MKTEIHNFKVGDRVTVFNRSFSKFVIEGEAEIVFVRPQEDMYNVKFFRRDNPKRKVDCTQIRYVDPNGQENPEEYLAQLNR
jgi:hypothetical protein